MTGVQTCALPISDYGGAARAWRRLLAVNPSSARTHSQLGALYQCLDRKAPLQLDSAERHLRLAHELNKEENGPLLHLGEVALLRGDPVSARRYFAAVLVTDTGNATAHFYTGYLAFKANNSSLAREKSRRSVAAPVPSSRVTGALSEGDTKLGNAPLRHDGERCGQLRALSGRTRTSDVVRGTSSSYRELDGLVSEARRRLR